MSWLDMAVMAIGTSCRLSSRLRAVTVISINAPPDLASAADAGNAIPCPAAAARMLLTTMVKFLLIGWFSPMLAVVVLLR